MLKLKAILLHNLYFYAVSALNVSPKGQIDEGDRYLLNFKSSPDKGAVSSINEETQISQND